MSEAVELELAETIVGTMQEEFPALDAYDEDEIASFEAKVAELIRSALATPQEGEPVAWRWRSVVSVDGDWSDWHVVDLDDRPPAQHADVQVQPLYTRPVAWPEGYKLVPVEPTEAMLAAARVAPTNSFRSHGPHYSDYASIYAAMLSASDGAGTEGGGK